MIKVEENMKKTKKIKISKREWQLIGKKAGWSDDLGRIIREANSEKDLFKKTFEEFDAASKKLDEMISSAQKGSPVRMEWIMQIKKKMQLGLLTLQALRRVGQKSWYEIEEFFLSPDE